MSKIEAPTAEDRELALRVAAWMKALADKPDASDYEHNLGVYGQIELVNAKGLGLVASAVTSFKREQTRRVEVEHARTESKHVGVVGARETFHVKLVGRWETEGFYGVTYIHKFEVVNGPDAGARLTWFGSNVLRVDDAVDGSAKALEPGDTCWIKATVKKHGEYKSVKETTLTRATLVDDPEVAKTKKANASRKAREATKARTTFGEPKILALWIRTGYQGAEIEVERVVQCASTEFRVETRKIVGGRYADGWNRNTRNDGNLFTTAEEAINHVERRFVWSGGLFTRKF